MTGRTGPLDLAARIDQVCDEFEAQWLEGRTPRVEEHLSQVPSPNHLEFLCHLLPLELHYRRLRQEALEMDEYLTRFPGHADAVREIWSRPLTPGKTVATSRRLAAKAPPADLPRIPGYEIDAVLGYGGMGVVYKARQIGLGRTVALKMILAGAHASPEHLSRFRSEAEAVARLHHVNIVQIYEIGEHEGRPFFSLEYVEGGSLDKRLAGSAQPPRDAAHMIETLARAVHAAHHQGIVHRDLKPANILLTADGVPKITDFGLAKRLESEGQTTTGAVLGTPSYMSPEQAAGKSRELGPAADVYALGAIFYEMLTGRPPHRGATTLDTVMLVLSDEPAPPARLQPRVPRDLDTICLKCLHKDPGRRYATAAALADDLRRFLDDQPIQARRVGAVGRLVRWCRRKIGSA